MDHLTVLWDLQGPESAGGARTWSRGGGGARGQTEQPEWDSSYFKAKQHPVSSAGSSREDR